MISLTCRNYTLLHQTSCERWFSLFRWLLNAPQFLTVVGIVTILNWRIFFFFFCSIQETKGTTQSPFLSSNCDWFPYLSTFSQGYSRGILKDVCVCQRTLRLFSIMSSLPITASTDWGESDWAGWGHESSFNAMNLYMYNISRCGALLWI